MNIHRKRKRVEKETDRWIYLALHIILVREMKNKKRKIESLSIIIRNVSFLDRQILKKKE